MLLSRSRMQRIQPPLFKVEVPPATPVGLYTIPIVASMLIATNIASPISAPATATVERATTVVDPEFQVSKKYPTIGYIAGQANLTINVIPPLTLNETFIDFWNTYGQVITLFSGGLVGAFSTLFIEHLQHKKAK